MHFLELRFRSICANLSAATLANALRRRRTVSVCAGLKRAKRGHFAYFALKLAPVPLRSTPGFRRAFSA